MAGIVALELVKEPLREGPRALPATGRAPDPPTFRTVVQNPKMHTLYAQAARVARSSAPVLITGETGSGKEHVAASIHEGGPRRNGPLVVYNCAAIPEGLLESTLFGHERGAFTGATTAAEGLFERAHGGILFLDEVGELSPTAQAVLLRACETKRITRLGSSRERAVDVQIVAATHRELRENSSVGQFRSDLYYRLSAVTLEVPPLRDRVDEIEPLARLFLERARRNWATQAYRIGPDTLDALRAYSWPGNVRELKHAVERACLLGSGDTLKADDLPESIAGAAPCAERASAHRESCPSGDLALKQQLTRFERTVIEEALRRSSGNRQSAAKLLRVPLRTLFRRMRHCGLNTA